MIQAQPAAPRWYFIPVRVALVTFLVALLSFAVSLLLGILGMVLQGRLRGIHPNMTLAYRYVALPTAVIVGAVALIVMTGIEVRNYRQSKALAAIARHSQ